MPLIFFLSCWLAADVGIADVAAPSPAVDVVAAVEEDDNALLLGVAVDVVVTSLRSGFGLFFVGNVCSRQPVPAASSSRSLVLRHFIRRFWNHIFTCESFNDNLSANRFLSGLLIYFCT